MSRFFCVCPGYLEIPIQPQHVQVSSVASRNCPVARALISGCGAKDPPWFHPVHLAIQTIQNLSFHLYLD